MAQLDFPDSPTIGDVFIAGSGSYEWTGTAWISKNLSAIVWEDIQEKPPEVETSATLEAYVDSRIDLVIDAAPAALDTLNELAAALGDDPNFAGTVTTSLAGKSDIGHTHVKTDITDFAHTHAISEVTNLQNSLDAKKTEVVYQIAANNTLVAGGRYFVDTNGARTLTLPAAPNVGDEIWIIDQTALAETNNITVNNNGLKINGVVDTLIIDVNGAIAVLLYTGSTLGWRI
jgi:hypothetical protein